MEDVNVIAHEEKLNAANLEGIHYKYEYHPEYKQCDIEFEIDENCDQKVFNLIINLFEKYKNLGFQLDTLQDNRQKQIVELLLYNKPAVNINRPISTELKIHETTFSIKINSNKKPIPFGVLLNSYFENRLNKDPILLQALNYYILPSIAAQPYSEERLPLNRKINEFLSPDNSQPLLLLQGDSGSGKSTFLYYLAKKQWEIIDKKLLNQDQYIPIVIEFKLFKKKDNDYLYEYFKEECKLNDLQVQELQQHYKILLLLDGYDELNDLRNLPIDKLIPGINKWNVKIVITCRSLYLSALSSYRLLFSFGHDHNFTQIAEYWLTPFSPEEVDEFIENYIKIAQPAWELQQYKGALTNIRNVLELIKTPLLLRLVIEVLPALNKGTLIDLTEVDIYKAFISNWFEREGKRLINIEGKSPSMNFLSERYFGDFAEGLAFQMFVQEENKTLLEIEYRPLHKQRISKYATKVNGPANNIWDKFFKDDDSDKINKRAGCPLRCFDNKYSFYHKSFFEYFAALYLYHDLGLGDDEEDNFTAALTNLSETDFNKKLVTKESAIAKFLAELIQCDFKNKERLLSIVKTSKRNPTVAIAAANAITVLNYARVSFLGLDLSEIQIPYADLTGAMLDSVCLNKAILTNVNFTHAILRQCDLTQTRLDNAIFGSIKPFEYSDGIPHAMMLSANKKWLAIGWSNGNLLIKSLNLPNQDFSYNLSKHRAIYAVAFSYSCTILVTAHQDNIINIFNLTSFTLEKSFKHTNTVIDIKFSPDDKYLVLGGNKASLTFYLANDSYQQINIDLQCNSIYFKIQLNPEKIQKKYDEAKLKNPFNSLVGLFDSNWGYYLSKTSPCNLSSDYTQRHVAFHPNGAQIARNDHVGVYIQSLSSDEIKFLDVGTSSEDICYSPEGKYIAASFPMGIIIIWDTINYNKISLNTPNNYRDSTLIGFIDEESLFFVANNQHTIMKYNIKSKIIKHIEDFGSQINNICFDNIRSCFYVGCQNGSVFMASSRESTLQFTNDQHQSSIKFIKYAPQAKIAVTLDDYNNIFIWEIINNKVIDKLNQFQFGDITSINIDANGQYLAIAIDDNNSIKLKIWDIKERKYCYEEKLDNTIIILELYLFCERGKLNILLFSQSRKIISISDILNDQSSIKIYDKNENVKFIQTLDNGSIAIGSLNENRKEIILCNFFDITHSIKCDDSIYDVAYSFNGNYLFTSTYNKLMLYEKDNNKFILKKEIKLQLKLAYTHYEKAIFLNLTSDMIAIISEKSHSIEIYSIPSLSFIAKFTLAPYNFIKTLTWISNSELLIGTDNGSLQKWSLVKNGNEYLACLAWISKPSFDCSNAKIANSSNISKGNYKLLKQFGATDYDDNMRLAKDSLKEFGSITFMAASINNPFKQNSTSSSQSENFNYHNSQMDDWQTIMPKKL